MRVMVATLRRAAASKGRPSSPSGSHTAPATRTLASAINPAAAIVSTSTNAIGVREWRINSSWSASTSRSYATSGTDCADAGAIRSERDAGRRSVPRTDAMSGRSATSGGRDTVRAIRSEPELLAIRSRTEVHRSLGWSTTRPGSAMPLPIPK